MMAAKRNLDTAVAVVNFALGAGARKHKPQWRPAEGPLRQQKPQWRPACDDEE